MGRRDGDEGQDTAFSTGLPVGLMLVAVLGIIVYLIFGSTFPDGGKMVVHLPNAASIPQ